MIEIMLIKLFQCFEDEADALVQKEVLEPLFLRGEAVNSVYLITSGTVKLCRFDRNGDELVLHRVSATNFIAEASVYSDTYHCDALSIKPTIAARMSKDKFRKLLDSRAELSHAWSAKIAHELQSTRFRSEILMKRKVGQRLNAWLEWNDGCLPPKGQWKDLAAEIGVTPEALYREIAKRT